MKKLLQLLERIAEALEAQHHAQEQANEHMDYWIELNTEWHKEAMQLSRERFAFDKKIRTFDEQAFVRRENREHIANLVQVEHARALVKVHDENK